MSGKRYTEEFKVEAVRQAAERRHPAAVAPNHLQREFSVPQPNRVWAADIT